MFLFMFYNHMPDLISKTKYDHLYVFQHKNGCKQYNVSYLVTSIVMPLLQFLLHKYVIC